MANKLFVENNEDRPAVVWQLDAPNENFTDLTNDIVGWDSYGLFAKTATDQLDYKRVRDKLIPLIIAAVYPDFSNWMGVSSEIRTITAKWIIAPYSLRLTQHSEEQDLIYFTELYSLSKGVDKYQQFGRRRVVSELSEHVAVNYYRTGLLTEAQSAQFVIDTESMIYQYLEFSSSSFITWVSAVDGYATKDYYSEGLKNELISIYYGNY